MLKLSTCVKRLRKRSGLSAADFGSLKIGVSHTAIVEWESGKGISPFNRMRLLDYARSVGAEPEIIEALEARQEELRP